MGQAVMAMAIGVTMTALLLLVGEGLLRYSAPSPPPPLPSPLGWNAVAVTLPPTASPTISNCGDFWGRPCLKDAAGLRVVVYGGSAAAGLPFSPLAAFPATLERGLSRHLNVPIEVLNFGTPGRNIRQVKETMALSMEALAPDLIIVYSGNNEFWEPMIRKGLNPNYHPTLERLRHELWPSALYRFLSQTYQARLTPKEGTPQGGGDPLEVAAPMDDDDRALVATLYEKYLTEIIELAKAKGIPLMVTTVVDDRLSPPWPEDGDTDPPPPSHREAIDALDLAFAARDKPQATIAYQRLKPLLGRGIVHFDLGQLYLRYGMEEAAQEQLDLAELYDTHPMRSNRQMRTIAEVLAEEMDVPFCDTAGEMASRSPQGLPTADVFFDWCHFNGEGHRRMGEILTGCIAQASLLGLSPKVMSSESPTLPEGSAYAHRLDRWIGQEIAPHVNEPLPCQSPPKEPGLPEACAGHLAFIGKDLPKAIEHYQASESAGAPPGTSALNLAWAYLFAGNIEQAQAQVARAEAAIPGDPDILNLKGIIQTEPP